MVKNNSIKRLLLRIVALSFFSVMLLVGTRDVLADDGDSLSQFVMIKDQIASLTFERDDITFDEVKDFVQYKVSSQEEVEPNYHVHVIYAGAVTASGSVVQVGYFRFGEDDEIRSIVESSNATETLSTINERCLYDQDVYPAYLIGSYTAKEDPAITTQIGVATGLVYNGKNQQLITSHPIASGGTLKGYAVVTGEDVPEPWDFYSSAYYTDLTRKDEGTYKVYYRIVGDENHNDKTFGPFDVTIGEYTNTDIIKPVTGLVKAVTYIEDINYELVKYIVKKKQLSGDVVDYGYAFYYNCDNGEERYAYFDKVNPGYDGDRRLSNSDICVINEYARGGRAYIIGDYEPCQLKEVTGLIKGIYLDAPDISKLSAAAFVSGKLTGTGNELVVYSINDQERYEWLNFSGDSYSYNSGSIDDLNSNITAHGNKVYIIGNYTEYHPWYEITGDVNSLTLEDDNKSDEAALELIRMNCKGQGWENVIFAKSGDTYKIARFCNRDLKEYIYAGIDELSEFRSNGQRLYVIGYYSRDLQWTTVQGSSIETIDLSCPSLSRDVAVIFAASRIENHEEEFVIYKKAVEDDYYTVLHHMPGGATSAFERVDMSLEDINNRISIDQKVYIIGTYAAVKNDPQDTTRLAAAHNLAYTGEALDLIRTEPVVTGAADVSYAVVTLGGYPAVFDLSKEQVTATEPGNYSIYYRVTGDATHKDKVFGPYNVTIDKASQEITALNASVTKATKITLVPVTGLHGDVTYAIGTTADIISYPDSLTWQSSTEFRGLTKKTQYFIIVKYAGDEHYMNGSHIFMLSTSDVEQTAVIGITPNDNITDPGIPYDGEPVAYEDIISGTPVLTNAENPDISYVYVGTGATVYAESETAPVNVGNYRMYVRMSDGDYYGELEFDFVIAKSSITGVPDAEALAPTSSSTQDGKITGVDDSMEYAVLDPVSGEYGEYVPVTGTEITGLSAGTKIKVRLAATTNTNLGPDKELTVPDYFPPYDPYEEGGHSSVTEPTNNDYEQPGVSGAGNDTVQVKATFRNGNATVNELSVASINRILESLEAGASKIVSLDFSEAETDVKKVTLTKSTVQNLVKASENDPGLFEGLEVKLSKSSVKLDEKALSAISGQANGNYVELAVEDKKVTDLNPAQQNVLEGSNPVAVIDIHLNSNGSEIHALEGGRVEISVDFTPEQGRSEDGYSVLYVSKEGETEKYPAKISESRLSFITGHFSDYVIVYDESAADDKEDDRASKTEKTEKLPYFKMSKTIGLGNRFSFSVTNVSDDATVKYTTSDAKIATVDKKGTVTAVGLGKCTVTGKITQNGVTYKFVLAVTVKDTGTGNRSIKEAECVTPEGEQPLLNVYKLVYKDSPVKLSLKDVDKNTKVTYTSENEKIATVSDKGVITGVKNGYTGINVTVEQNGQTYSYRVYVRVK